MKQNRRKNSQKTGFPVAILLIGFVLILAAVVVLVQNNGDPVVNQDAIERFTPAEAQQAVESGDAILLDVRSETSFAEVHARDAVNIPLEDLPSRLDELDPQKWVITYCT